MDRTKLAWMWASAIIASAIASSFGVIGGDMAEGLYLGLLMGAGVSLSLAPCRSC